MNRKSRTYPTLKAWRLGTQRNQVDAARFLGISQAFYSKLERGVQFPDRLNAKMISEKAQVPLETVLGLPE